ncbi:hypothetical protein GDO81_003630 [Engystomops pustulosus]|uniref:Uncharacterized protein n=1 Tax=Engystomops pustulosus TaxID=76066 RepID=A0AAV7A5V5_ENGPU|nr:hypothetical protein GDO81_003630 [Engystomops pustulosus]
MTQQRNHFTTVSISPPLSFSSCPLDGDIVKRDVGDYRRMRRSKRRSRTGREQSEGRGAAGDHGGRGHRTRGDCMTLGSCLQKSGDTACCGGASDDILLNGAKRCLGAVAAHRVPIA